MDLSKIFDPYTLRARTYPALIASGSLIVVLAVLAPWDRLSWAHGIAAAAVPIILWLVSDVARRQGRKVEAQLYKKWGGKPSTVMLRHGHSELIDEDSKARHLAFLGKKIGAVPPTAAEEATDATAADRFYDRCGNWLRENTRDTKRFSVLFAELITYGYRRNLFAVKRLAVTADVLLIIGAATFFLYIRPSLDSVGAFKAILIGVVAALHSVLMWLIAAEENVREAAEGYARQLFLCCEVLNTTAPRKAAGASKRTKVST